MGVTPSPDPEVFVGIASFGERARTLQTAVESLIGQVDRIGVYLNNYRDVPDFLHHPRIEVARSQDHGDVRDNGKFFFLQRSTHRYYAAADDDLEYPGDYVDRLRAILEDAGPRAAVGVHGAIYPTRIIGLAKPRRLFHFLDSLPHVMPVHLIGTGTLLFEQDVWNLEYEEFGDPGMADVWFAIAAKKRDASLFMVNRSRQWLTEAPAESTESRGRTASRLYAEAKIDDSRQVELLSTAGVSRERFRGLVEALFDSERFTEDFSLAQAIFLDEVRRDMGWRPLDPSTAGAVETRIAATRTAWAENSGVTNLDVEAYTAAAAGVLMEDLAPDVVDATLNSLEPVASLAGGDREAWKKYPHAVRFDTRGRRFKELSSALLSRAFRDGSSGVGKLWPRLKQSTALPIDLALQAERAGIETRFQRQSKLKTAAMSNPLRAALLLADFFEARDWSVDPDVLSWKRAFGSSFATREVQLLLCMTALRTGNREMAMRCVDAIRLRWPGDFDVRMMEAAAVSASENRLRQTTISVLRVLDDVLDHVGVRPYRQFLRDEEPGIMHWIDLFRVGPAEPESPDGLPRVSVVMSVYNQLATVRQAIQSVLASQGAHIEVIVVDDASTDGTAEAVRQIEDSRVEVVRNGENVGPYVSRNVALQLATGDFITIADADDWSHPDRFAFQSARLRDEPDLVACTVGHVRLRPGGEPDLENNLRFLGHGPVSLMIRRSVLDQVGGFDHVRTRGDIEYIRRLQARFGEAATGSYEVPLILATSSPRSNSKLYASEVLGRYRRASREWHADNAMSDSLYVPLTGERAPFVAPEELIVPSPVKDSPAH